MPSNTHTTATVRLQLDLAGLIAQLRNLADTLETTHKPKTDPQGLPPEYDGETSDEALAALRRKLSGQPEPSHFTDGTKPARNPHTLDLPEGMDPAEAEHILRVTESHGLRCTRCEHPYHRRSICPACGCDPRRADHGADPR